MTVGEQLVGAIYIFRAYGGSFSSNDRQVLESFADQPPLQSTMPGCIKKWRAKSGGWMPSSRASADGILILDAAHHITVFNRALTRMTGLGAAEALHARHDEVIQLHNKRAGMTLAEAERAVGPGGQRLALRRR